MTGIDSGDLHVGCRTANVSDPIQGVAISLRLLYPTPLPGRAERFGPYEMNVAMNAPAAGAQRPLVVISHGGGGSSLTHRDLASYLVRAGYVIALLDHPGNNRLDNSLEGTTVNLEHRPRHISLVIDAAYADEAVGSSLSGDKVAMIGHSMGGYTALALAGGRPIVGPLEPGGTPQPVAVSADRRIRALVLLAPACGWFWAEGALADIDLPILLRTAEKDELGHHLHTEFIQRGVCHPERVDHRIVPNAGHHAFQSSFPPAMSGPHFPPSQDPVGFDRRQYQPVLHAEIGTFLASALRGGEAGGLT